ncbi:hypothetical protein JTM68_31770, partial [Pseudomonas aeruginosa]|nr:hypothetical protein [Pseudomonas aeruginosa]
MNMMISYQELVRTFPKLKQRIIPAVIELMITDSHRIVGHRIHNIDYRFALRQATDVRPGKIISGIKTP